MGKEEKEARGGSTPGHSGQKTDDRREGKINENIRQMDGSLR
jgi:hypothetical protein